MENRKYSVFISSTYEDLKEERRAVQDQVVRSGDFPVQMEDFPATDEDQFEFIKALISKCDFYILIVGGRYGNVAADGQSYTEREFSYAKEIGIPILAMLHGDRDSIALSKSETTDAGRERLARFIQKIENGRLRRAWKTVPELTEAVAASLLHAKQTKNRPGWLRGDTVAQVDALAELNELRRENAKFRTELGELAATMDLPPLPPVEAELEIDLLPNPRRHIGSSTYARLKASWKDIFPYFYTNLQWYFDPGEFDPRYHIRHDESCERIGSALAQELAVEDVFRMYRISENTLYLLKSYYIEAGLMFADGDEPFTEFAKKLARRARIAGRSKFETTAGSVSVVPGAKKNSEFDDDIPF